MVNKINLLAVSASTQIASVIVGKFDLSGKSSNAGTPTTAPLQSLVSFSEQTCNITNTHSEFINIAAEKCLYEQQISFSDLQLLAVDIGPGSFTGIRSAINFIKTLSYSLNLPVWAKTSNSLVSCGIEAKLKKTKSITGINAHRNLVFSSFDGGETIHLLSNDIFLEEVRKKTAASADSITKEQSALMGQPFKENTILAGDFFKMDFFKINQRAILNSTTLRPKEEFDFPNAKTFLDLLDQYLLTQSENFSVKKLGTFDWKSLNPLYIRESSAEEKLRELSKTK